MTSPPCTWPRCYRKETMVTDPSMLADPIRHRLRTVLAPLRVVYGAMFGSILVYWIVVQVIRKVAEIPRGRDVFAAVDWLRYPLYVLGLATCVAVVVMRRRLFGSEEVIRRAQGRNLPELLSTLSSSQILAFAVPSAREWEEVLTRIRAFRPELFADPSSPR